jgi:hypothetical protein
MALLLTDEMTPRHEVQRPRVQSKLRSCSADYAPVSSILTCAVKIASGSAAAPAVAVGKNNLTISLALSACYYRYGHHSYVVDLQRLATNYTLVSPALV